MDIPYTERDIRLIYKVFVKRYATTNQIWRWFFPNTKHMRACQERLRKLSVEYGLLRSIEQAYKRGESRPPLIWSVTKLGGELLVYERGVDPQLIRNLKPWADEDKNQKLKHILAATEFEFTLLDACALSQITLVEWLDEREFGRQATKSTETFLGPQGEPLKPPKADLLFVLGVQNRKAIFHAEIDRASEDIGFSNLERESITGKLLLYIYWEENLCYREQFGTRPLRVTFVTTGARRMSNMVKAAERVIQQRVSARSDLSEQDKQAEFARLAKRFRFITFDRVQPETLLTQPVWSIAGDDKLHSLFD